MFETPIAKSVRFGSDLRRKGSILSIAAIVASDSTPSMSVSVSTTVKTPHQSDRSARTPWKWGRHDAVFERVGREVDQVLGIQPHDLTHDQAEDGREDLRRQDFHPLRLRGSEDENESQGSDSQNEHLRLHVQELRRCLGHDAPEFVSVEGMSQHEGKLLGDDQEADRGEHPLDDGGREDRAEPGGLEVRQDKLHEPRQADGDEQEADSRPPGLLYPGAAFPRATPAPGRPPVR